MVVDSGNEPTSDNNENTSPNQNKDPPAGNRPACKFYLRRGCKHGRKGVSCKFDHPKLCFKYTKYGDKRGGCREGKDCRYFHPKLCNSYKSGVCSRPNCNFYHVSGTKMSKEIPATPDERQAPRNVDERTPLREIVERPRLTQPTRVLQRPQAPNDEPYIIEACSDKTTGLIDHRDFLDMKSQLRLIQDQLQLLMAKTQTTDRMLPRSSVWGQHQ